MGLKSSKPKYTVVATRKVIKKIREGRQRAKCIAPQLRDVILPFADEKSWVVYDESPECSQAKIDNDRIYEACESGLVINFMTSSGTSRVRRRRPSKQ